MNKESLNIILLIDFGTTGDNCEPYSRNITDNIDGLFKIMTIEI